MAGRVRSRVRVRGLVQGVYFRESTRRAAQPAGVAGWIRNLADGSVEAVFEGAEDAVAEVVAFCRIGPPDARVEQVEVTSEAPGAIAGFTIRHSAG
jgi:acylphosphatase